MREFSFSDEDLKAIDADRYHRAHPHVQRKMGVLWLKATAGHTSRSPTSPASPCAQCNATSATTSKAA